VPFLLICVLGSNWYLAEGIWYQRFLLLQLAFYAWACLGLLFRTRLQRVPYALIGYFMLAMNLAILEGFFRALRREKVGTWERIG